MLREGIVIDICKDNLFVVHQIITKSMYKDIPKYEDAMDPYTLYVDGKLIWEEYLKLNKKRNEYLDSEPDYEYIDKIELRNTKHDQIVSVTHTQVQDNNKVYIGRGLEADIRIEGDPSVSRKH